MENATVLGESVSDRISGFNGELQGLLGKYRLVLFAEPRIVKGIIVADPKLAPVEEMNPKPEPLGKNEAQN
jgi:hypothetical protein